MVKKESASSQTAITPTRTQNFPEWFQSVVAASDMAENAPVRGCMVFKPYGYAVWENIQSIFGKTIKKLDVQNAYFPLLIPLSYMSKEAEHIDGFAKECAVVTHHRLEVGEDGKLVAAGPLSEPFIIRPTSETIIGEVISGWVKSYRDLPLKLNQWCNVMRWEKRPRIFIRPAEFLWQEGHNCFATSEEAQEDALKMLQAYVDFMRVYLALPGLPGEKTDDEKFPGAINTYTYEGMMQDGKALQMCTSHNLGQTFSKGANIQFLDKSGVLLNPHTTSWGMSIRAIGAMIMTHADDDGMVMPPKIAPYQVCIIPILRGSVEDGKILEQAFKIKTILESAGIESIVDVIDEKPQNKIWRAIKRGVPMRIEIGIKEVENSSITYSRRDESRSIKHSTSLEAMPSEFKKILDSIQSGLYERAEKRLNASIVDAKTPADVGRLFEGNHFGFVRLDTVWLDHPDVQKARSDFPITPRCKPLEYDGNKVVLGLSY